MSFLDFELPTHLIAQDPPAVRGESRLMVLPADGRVLHRTFSELPNCLRPGDLLVLNDSRVVKARFHAIRARTGGRVEGLYLRTLADGRWEVMTQSRGTLTPGETLTMARGGLRLTLDEPTSEGRWSVRPQDPRPALEILNEYGEVPLPPYIRRGEARAEDVERYQTVYAGPPGSVAAPTAGLHFTHELLAQLREHGVESTRVTLHVGVGTFAPIRVEDYREHRMHAEWGELSSDAADAICRTRERGGRIVAVGTTSVRVLESVARTGAVQAWSGETDIFIYPPFDFRLVDLLITNFHLPRSTLLLLVAAFAGEDRIRGAYASAVAHAYRFFSYGDAMLIERSQP